MRKFWPFFQNGDSHAERLATASTRCLKQETLARIRGRVDSVHGPSIATRTTRLVSAL